MTSQTLLAEQRKLSKEEIENIISFIKPKKGIPYDTAMQLVKTAKDKIRNQLRNQKIYPEMIPQLKIMIKEQYISSQITPGESVGPIAAQSIGEKQTQSTLNSIDWKEKLFYTFNGDAIIEPIGKMIDRLLIENSNNITHIKKNRTEYLELQPGYKISSCNDNGSVDWYSIEAVTRHLPVGKLVKVTTETGRSVIATQSKSFLVWDGKKFIGTNGSNIKIGDIVPVTSKLLKPYYNQKYFNMESVFSKTKYLYTTELCKILKYKKENDDFFKDSDFYKKYNGKTFTVPYENFDDLMGKQKDYLSSCKPGLIYLNNSNNLVSQIPDKIPLDSDFGFFVGLYLCSGWTTKTFLCINNNNYNILNRITNFCNKYKITYHLLPCRDKIINKKNHNILKIHSTILARLFKLLCNNDLNNLDNKKIPSFVYTSPIEFIKGFLDGVISSDRTNIDEEGNITISFHSENIILGISFIMSYFDVFTHLNNNNNLHILNITTGYSQILYQNIQITSSCKKKILFNISSNKYNSYYKELSQKNFPDRNVYFDKVVSVEYTEGSTKYVYDLTVETTRNFQLFNSLNVVDTFHKAGSGEKAVTTGVPRVEEILSATKGPKNSNVMIYMKNKHNSIAEIRDTIKDSIVEINFTKICKSYKININKSKEKWYDSYALLYNDDFRQYKDCITIYINIDILYEYKLSLKKISEIVSEKYSDMCCVFSPENIGQIDIFVDTTDINLPENRLAFINSENAAEIYLEEVVQPILFKILLCGIEGINTIYFTDDIKCVETEGSNFSKILGLPFVDSTKTFSNNVWDIYNILGVEAARQFLIEECMSIMEGINLCHIQLLAEKMTYNGSIASVSRYTMRNEECGPMGKASFEETMDNFIKAGIYGQEESTCGVSASIICGKLAQIGTGICDIKIDIGKLPNNVINEDVVENSNNFNTYPSDKNISFDEMKLKILDK